MEVVEKYIKKQVVQFRKNYVLSGKPRNYDAIHDFRVALKRLIAIARFVKEHHDLNNVMNVYKISHLKHFYKTGGELREIQINKKILKSYSRKTDFDYSLFKEYLSEKEKRSSGKLKKSREKLNYKKVKKFESLLINRFNEISKSDLMNSLDDYIATRIKEIETLITDHHVEDKLHRIRKLVKGIKYMMEMTGHEERSYGDVNFATDRITLLEDHIGNWHDLYVFRNELSEFMASLSRKGHSDEELMVLSLAVENDYRDLFDKTVQWIYNDFVVKSDEGLPMEKLS